MSYCVAFVRQLVAFVRQQVAFVRQLARLQDIPKASVARAHHQCR